MSQSKIYVGNLSYSTTEDELRDHFSQYGNIEDIKLIIDYNTGRSKGFGFISFSGDEEAEKSLAAKGLDFGGRKLKVNIAREGRPSGSGGGFGGSGGGFRRQQHRSYSRDGGDRGNR